MSATGNLLKFYRAKKIKGNNMENRQSQISRKTKETDITLSLSLDGRGQMDGATGAAFFDHMLEQVARHGGLDITLQVKGDLHIEVCSLCHPFYSGKQKILDTAGRVDKFNRKYSL